MEFKYASSVTDSLRLLPGTTLYGYSIVMKKGSEWHENSGFRERPNPYKRSRDSSTGDVRPENRPGDDRVPPTVDGSPLYDISVVSSNRDEISDSVYRGDYEEISYPYGYRDENGVHGQVPPEPIVNPNLIYCGGGGGFRSRIADEFKNESRRSGYDAERNSCPKNVESYRFQRHAYNPTNRQNDTKLPSRCTGRGLGGRDKKEYRTAASHRSMENVIVLS